MKKIFPVIILSVFLAGFIGGCKFSDWAVNKDLTGKTKLEQGINTVGEGMQNYGQGTVVGLAGTLLLTIGGLVTFIRKTLVERSTNNALIVGVQEADNKSVKESIKKVAIQRNIAERLRQRVAKVTGDPNTGM